MAPDLKQEYILFYVKELVNPITSGHEPVYDNQNLLILCWISRLVQKFPSLLQSSFYGSELECLSISKYL